MKVEQRKSLILYHLQSGKPTTKARLAEVCGCSSKTVLRAKNSLQADGYEILETPDGYLLPKTSDGKDQLHDDLTVGIISVAGGVIDKNLELFRPSAAVKTRELFLKIKGLNYTPEEFKRAMDVAKIHFTEQELMTFGRVMKCIINGLAITMRYQKPYERNGEERELFPVQLKERDGVWYLLAYDFKKKAGRTFTFKCIQNVSFAKVNYKHPSQEVIDCILKKGQFSIWDNPESPSIKVQVKLYDNAAWFVANHQIHPSQSLEKVSEREVVMTIDTTDEVGMIIWLRKFAPYVKIISPDWFRENFISDLKQAIQNHG